MILAVLLAAAVPVFGGCVPGQKPEIRPAKIVITCADANFYVTALRWSSWSTSAASAGGTAHVNDCSPYCAAGHFHAYRATIALARPARCRGRMTFTRLTWRFVRGGPKGQPRTGSIAYTCR